MNRRDTVLALLALGAVPKPGNLPIEQATTLELVVNLKSAEALAIAIPQSILLRTDRVIE